MEQTLTFLALDAKKHIYATNSHISGFTSQEAHLCNKLSHFWLYMPRSTSM